MIFLAAVLALALAASSAAAQDIMLQPEAIPAPTGSLVIRDLDAIWTATGERLERASIAIEDGRIVAIRDDVATPDDARVIDGRGLTAMPGIVDEHSHIAMESTNEGSTPISAEVEVVNALDAEDFGIYEALAGGVTTAQILHGSANPIGGQSAIIKTRWGMDHPWKLLIPDAPQTIKFALGENVTDKNSPGGGDRFPATRAGVEALYIEAFSAAQDYRAAWDAYREDPESFRVPPRRDLRLETLVDVLEGRIRVHAHSYRADEILMLMRVAEDFGFRIDCFTHVLEGYKVADEMAAHGACGSTFSDWWMYKLEAYDAIPYNAAIMHRHGVSTSINTDIPWLQATFVYEMMKPAKYGSLSKLEAMQMVTLNPATQLRVDHRVGSLEVGKDGDVVLLNGDPFNTYSRVEKTIIDGIVYYDRAAEADTRDEPVTPLQVALPETAPQPAADSAAGPETPPALLDVPATTPAVVALVGGTVHPISSPVIADGVVVMRDGRIAAVGAASQVDIPAGARTIDVSGRHVYPGIIEPSSQLGLVDIESWNAARDDEEIGEYNPHVRALFSVNPHIPAINVARANGITAAMAIPGSGTIPGTASVVQLKGDTPERMAIEDRAALVVDFPEPEGEDWEEPKLEGDDIEELLTLFRRAEHFVLRPTVNEDPTDPLYPSSDPNNRVLLAAMVPAMTGEIPTFFNARSERVIRTVLMFTDSFPNLRPVIVGGDEAFLVADELAARDIPVLVGSGVTPFMNRDFPVSAGWMNAAALHAAGVKVGFTTQMNPNGSSDVRNLPYHAARAVAWGLEPKIALRAITLNNAEILGLGDEMGSLEPGKRADIIVTDGDPLQILTHVERMFIAGDQVPLTSKHTELWLEFRDRQGGMPVVTEQGGQRDSSY